MHLERSALESGLAEIRSAPRHEGVVKMIVRRPSVGAREVVDEGVLDPAHGLVGDSWSARGDHFHKGAPADPAVQLTVMGARTLALIAGDRGRWPEAGDQLIVDLDLSAENLPPGTRLAIGDAVIEVSEPPHTGCAKFVKRFGVDAMKFVNSPVGRSLNLRGINARVVKGGAVRTGDRVVRQPAGVVSDAAGV
jgi:MOSC domain-containing protein YiiM